MGAETEDLVAAREKKRAGTYARHAGPRPEAADDDDDANDAVAQGSDAVEAAGFAHGDETSSPVEVDCVSETRQWVPLRTRPK